jgi:hypothetical protein
MDGLSENKQFGEAALHLARGYPALAVGQHCGADPVGERTSSVDLTGKTQN